MENLDRDSVVDLIASVGSKVTVMVEGHIGSGKSAIIKDLGERFKDTHSTKYLDMTTIDIGDLQLPAVNHEDKTSEFYPNVFLGIHEDVPQIIMFDEFGKSHPGVKNAVLPMLIERRIGNTKFHPDTIVFATTNLGEENVGDMFRPHERNRMTFVRMAKPDVDSWVAWGAKNGVVPEVLAWVIQNPQSLDSFEGIEDPKVNPYIFHPKEPRTSFVTHRSLEQASHIIKAMRGNEEVLAHALAGTIGAPAAMDLLTFVGMGNELPTRSEIIANPATAPIPENPAARVMVCVQASSWVDKDNIDSWMEYMERFDQHELKAFWAGLIASMGKVSQLSGSASFTTWLVKYNYLFR